MTSGQNGGPNRGQNERLRALLAEAREWLVNGTCRECDRRGGCKMRQRIDAALAEPVDADAYRRGAEAMREAAAQVVIREVDSWMQSSLTDEIRDLPIPEDKP